MPSFPYWERGLKFLFEPFAYLGLLSFPYWERGLKFKKPVQNIDIIKCRSLIGNVDWNGCPVVIITQSCSRSLIGNVDWNGDRLTRGNYEHRRSLIGNVDWNLPSSWLSLASLCRSLIGNVDWNIDADKECTHEGKSFPYWERGLKYACQRGPIGHRRRSLIGNVDWNATQVHHKQAIQVVPLLGTWIEI